MTTASQLDNLQQIPAELQALKQWLCYKLEKRQNSHKFGKPPVDPQSGRNISWTDPKSFLSYAEALSALKENKPQNLAGIGLVFTGTEPYSGADLDNCLDDTLTPLNETFTSIISRLNTYTEISPSGKGLRLIGIGKLPNNDAGGKHGDCEAYSSKRFLTITGNVFQGKKTINEFADAFAWFRATHASPKKTVSVASPQPLVKPSLNDIELVEKIRTAKNGDKFMRLMGGDTTLHQGDSSAADLALCSILSWYTRDASQIDRIFRGSRLFRPKWDEARGQSTYGKTTIEMALQSNPGMPNRPLSAPLQPAPILPPPSSQPTKKTSSIQTISAAELQKKQLPQPKWAVPSLIPEGLTILAGRPKRGKSWLALGLSLAVASGGLALGKIKVAQGGALFFGLEDNERRLQNRLSILTSDNPDLVPDALQITTRMAHISAQTLDDLKSWLDEKQNIRLVVIDTLQKITPPSKGRDLYAEMYTVLGSLQKFAIDNGLAIVVNHHTTKQKTDSALDAVHGTTAITGVADSILVLGTGKGGASAILHTTGRDIESQELALNFDGGIWTIMGDAEFLSLSPQRKAVIDLVKQHPMSPKELADALQVKLGTINKILFHMKADGQITQERRGLYQLPPQQK